LKVFDKKTTVILLIFSKLGLPHPKFFAKLFLSKILFMKLFWLFVQKSRLFFRNSRYFEGCWEYFSIKYLNYHILGLLL